MNEKLIENFNNTVQKDDVVFILGDFAMGKRDVIPSLLSRLNGRIILIAGNHDHKKSRNCFLEVYDSAVLTFPVVAKEVNFKNPMKGFEDDRFFDGGEQSTISFGLVHIPHQQREHFKDMKLNGVLCGHIHNLWISLNKDSEIPDDYGASEGLRNEKTKALFPTLNVGVDVHDYRPININQVLGYFGMESIPDFRIESFVFEGK
jgi:calcineurin-like phosphoesterase family protein